MNLHKRILGFIIAFLTLFVQSAIAGTHNITNESEFKNAIITDGLVYDDSIVLNLDKTYLIDYDKVYNLISQTINESGDLSNLINSYSSSLSGSDSYVKSVEINLNYIETAEQRAYVDNFIKNNFSSIVKGAKNDFEKVFLINEWIINNVKYDYTYTKYSSYEALYSKSAVCNGYAMLFNKMAIAAGLDSKVIVGKAKEQNHAWNAVKLNGYWYFIDTTWNDSNPANTYLLLSLKDIEKDHIAESVIPQPVAQKSYYLELIDAIINKKNQSAFDYMSKLYGDFGFSKDVLYNVVVKSLKSGTSQRVIYPINKFSSDLSSITSMLLTSSNIKTYFGGRFVYNGVEYMAYDVLVSGTLKSSMSTLTLKNLGLMNDTEKIKANTNTVTIEKEKVINIEEYFTLLDMPKENLAFSIENPLIARLEGNFVKGLAQGTTEVVAYNKLDPTIKATITLIVKEPTVPVIIKKIKDINTKIGSNFNIYEYINFTGITRDGLAYIVENKSGIIEEIGYGLFRAVKEGYSTIRVYDKANINNFVDININIQNSINTYNGIKVVRPNVNGVVGTTLNLENLIEAYNVPTNAIKFVNISNNGVISLNGKYAKLNKVGTSQVKIYNTLNPSMYGIITIKVYAKVTSLKVSSSVIKTKVNKTAIINANVNSDAYNKELGFEVIGNKIVTVDRYGVVKGLAKGKTIVKVYSKENPSIYKNITVYVE